MRHDEKTKLSAIPGGPEALAAIEAATAALPDLEKRSRDADDLAARTKAGRDGLANAGLVGMAVKPGDLVKADKAVADADAAATMARDALGAGRKAVTDLDAAAVRMVYAERDRLFREAADRRIAAAEELDRLGAAFGLALAAFAEAGAVLNNLVYSSDRLEQRIASLRDRKAYAVLPVSVQNDIAQQGRAAITGAVLGSRERALWS
jgi:hypothetical protein